MVTLSPTALLTLRALRLSPAPGLGTVGSPDPSCFRNESLARPQLGWDEVMQERLPL